MRVLHHNCLSVDELLALDWVSYSDDSMAKIVYDLLRVMDKVLPYTRDEKAAVAWYLFRKSWLAATRGGWMYLSISIPPGEEYGRRFDFMWKIRIQGYSLHSTITTSPGGNTLLVETDLIGFHRKDSINVNSDRAATLASATLNRLNGHSLLIAYSEALIREADRKYRGVLWNHVAATIFDNKENHPFQIKGLKYHVLGGQEG